MREVSGDGVRVGDVCTTLIMTAFIQQIYQDQIREKEREMERVYLRTVFIK